MDLAKAFDSFNREKLLLKLKKFGVPKSFCELLFFCMNNLKLNIISNYVVSDSFYSSCGLPQGDCLSPILFLAYLADLPASLAHSVF